MLKDSLYSVISIDEQEVSISAVVKLNATHPIFKGHFPDQPVLPGACMLQMLKELLQQALKTKIRLKKADQLKFLSPVDPVMNDMLEVNISYFVTEDDITANALMKIGNNICLRFKGVFIIL
jgi:3-hydroxyacyl-[acyl-carrier-protein] dehydratase